MESILSNYTFIVVALGTTLLAGVSGMIGVISVLKGQSLIGDAISHSTLPGIVLAFIILQTKSTIGLTIGAIIIGILAYALIQVVSQHSTIDLDTTLAIVLTFFFGLGMTLLGYISKHPKSSQAGLANYIFGSTATMLISDVILIAIVCVIAIILLVLFYKEIKVFVFDPIHARLSGYNIVAIHTIVLIMTMVLIAVGIQSVGVILVSAMLIAPGVTALQWSYKFSSVLIISLLVGAVSGFVGTYLSSVYPKLSTGALIVLIMSAIALFSIIFGKNGILRRKKDV